MPAQTLAAVAALASFAVHGNRIDFVLDHGNAELVWATPASFRFRRTLDGPLPEARTAERQAVRPAVDDTPGTVVVRSRLLEVIIQKSGLLVRVRRLDGSPLVADLSEPHAVAGGVEWERQAPAGARFYGLGPRAEPALDLRGKSVLAEVPFLVSSAGYGESHVASGTYRFDFTAHDRYRIQAPAVDYYFHYGPAAKQVFEERREVGAGADQRQSVAGQVAPAGQVDVAGQVALAGQVATAGQVAALGQVASAGRVAAAGQVASAGRVASAGQVAPAGRVASAGQVAPAGQGPGKSWNAAPDSPASWESLKATLLRLVHGAMSGMTAPSLALRPYAAAPPELQRRARELGSLVDDVSPGPLDLSPFRRQLETFFATYDQEIRDRGFPIWHPLVFQFPADPECARHADEFMLGDELLVAPVYEPGGRRPVYLPQGVWTNLETNAVSPGRRTVAVETASLPVFARNGTIVPLDSGGGISLHYFPKLAAEFFLFESDPWEWSQVHAAPAADIVRLEIESKKARDYEWVVHHTERPAEVGFEETRFPQAPSRNKMPDRTWFWDAAQKNLHVRLHVAAGEDRIVNLVFP